jgi:lauroyl/myristoyl acyltransferase
MPILILTLNNFTPGYRLQYLARRGENMEIVPTSIETLRLAKKRLKSGGSILTGLDRPLPQQEGVKYQPRFFGKPSNLPVAYVRLALDTGAPVTVAGCIPQPDGSYRIEVSELVVMQPEKSMYDSIINNTERVLAIAEPMVRQYADHWSMFHPVWRYDE